MALGRGGRHYGTDSLICAPGITQRIAGSSATAITRVATHSGAANPSRTRRDISMGSRCAGQDVQAPDTCPEGIRVQQLRVVSVADGPPPKPPCLS